MTAVAEKAPLDRLARTSALNLSGSIVAAVVGFALAMTLTRSLDAVDAGAVFTVMALLSLLVGSCLLGADTGVGRFLLRAEAGGPGAVRALLRVALVPPLLCSAALGFSILLLRHPLGDILLPGSEDGSRLLLVVALTLPMAVLGELALASTRAWGSFRPTVWIDRLVRPVLQLAAVLLVLHLGGDTSSALAVWAVGFAVGTTAACRALSRTLERPSWLGAVRPTAHRLHGGGASDGRTFWRFTAPRGIAGLAQVGVQRVDILLVAVLLSPTDAAVYAVATRFVAVGQLASMAVHQVLQPQFTALLMRGESVALSTVHGTATAWSILLVWPLYLVVLGSPLTYLSLFGDAGSAYARGTSVVVVMAVAMLLAVASGPVDTLLLMAGHSGLSMVNALTALSLDVLLCVLLLPRWGIVGAAVAWAVAVSVRSALGLLQVGRLVRVLPNPHPLLVAGLVPVVCFLLPALGWRAAGGTGTTGWVLVLASGVAGYLVLLSRLRHTLGLDVLHAALVRPPRSPSVRPADPDAAPRGAVHER